jgi:1,2-phenylacetyl-CoA epoxidase catalytic subunit
MAQPLPDSRLLEILQSQGYRELISAHLFANAVRVAPSIDDKHVLLEQAGEELAHFEVITSMYEHVCGKSLYEAIAARADALPVPSSWLEIAVAAYLVDRAAAVQLAAYEKLGDERLSKLIHKILDHEHKHLTAAQTTLRDQCHADAGSTQLAQQHVERWFALARTTLDVSSETAAAFVNSVRSTLSACGLQLPKDAVA